MRKLISVLLLSSSAFAQTNSGHVVMSGKTALSTNSRAASLTMGLVDYNGAASTSSGTMDAMQFVYSQFQQNTGMPHPSADNCTAVYNGKIYIIGGYGTDPNTPLNYVQIYNPTTDAWTQGATITTAEWGAGCALYNGKIYTFGGVANNSETPTANAYVYDIAGNSWSTLTSLPSTVKSGTMAVTVGSFIYIRYLGTLWKFDPTGNSGLGSYTSLTAPPTNAVWAATGYVNVSGDDRIYYLGGNNGTSDTSAGYYYSVTSDTWSGSLAAAPYAARGEVQNAVSGGKIYYACGFNNTVFFDGVYSYDPALNSWSSLLANMNSFRDGCGGGFSGNNLYVIGGRNSVAAAFGMSANESLPIGRTIVSQPFTKIHLNYTTGGPSGSVNLCVYADSSGVPGSLLRDAGTAAVANGDVSISGLNLSLTQGTRYWLAFEQSAATVTASYTSGAPKNVNGSGTAHCFATTSFGSCPSPFPASPTCTSNTMYAMKLTVN